MRSTLALLMLMFSATSGLADPFDDWCKAVRLPSSIAICSDPELLELTRGRQHAYDEAKAQLSPDAKKALLADQNAWVKSYPAACGLEQDRPPELPLSPAVRECMAQAGRARIIYLRAYGSAPASPRPQSAPPTSAGGPSRIGPSFDCAKATQPLATMICANPLLSELDLRFVQAYQALRQQVGPDGQQQLRQEAVEFQQSVLQTCGIPETGAVSGSADCVATQYAHQRALWLPRLQGPAHEEATRPIGEHLALQARLQKLGFLPATAEVDGIYGDATRAAIIAWQHANGRPETGYLGDADVTALEPVAETASSPAPSTETAAPPAEPEGAGPPDQVIRPDAALSEIFPLKHGIYVSSNVPCGQASFGTFSSYDGKGITVGHASCEVKVLNKSGNIYKISSKCYSERDDSTTKLTEVYTITSYTSFTVKNEYGEFSSRYCERSSLPWPWGNK